MSCTSTRTPGTGTACTAVAKTFERPDRVHVGDEATADLGVGVGRDDGLGALALEAAPDAVHVERRPGASSLQGQEVGLAEQLRDADAGGDIGLRRTAAGRTRRGRAP